MDFVEFLLAKAEENATRQEEVQWSRTGSAYMMQRMDDEEAMMHPSNAQRFEGTVSIARTLAAMCRSQMQRLTSLR